MAKYGHLMLPRAFVNKVSTYIDFTDKALMDGYSFQQDFSQNLSWFLS